MTRAVIAALSVLLGLSIAARADLKPGTYAPDIEAKDWANTDGEPISLAECRGMVVVLFFWVSWHEGGEAIMPLMTLVNASRYGRQAGVFLIGLTDADRKRVEDMLKKEKVFFPIGMEAKRTFEDYDIKSYPRVVIIDANGKVAWSGWPGAKGGAELIEQIGKVVAETPPTRTHPEEAAKAEAYLEQARQALREDRYRDAFRAASSALEHALRGDRLRTRCQDMLDLIEVLGREKLARADRCLSTKDFEEAVTLLVEVRRDFQGGDVASSARKKLRTLEKKYPEVAQILQQQEDIGAAETMLAAAMEEIRAGRFGPGYEKLEEIISEYGSTETAAKAQTLLERMRKNEGVMGYVRDHKAARPCRTLMSQAEAYQRTGRIAKAREFYREIMDKYPDTIYADEAARRLAQLP